MKTKDPVIAPEEYVALIIARFTEAGDPVRAELQRAYMRDQFEYCGLGAPVWMAMARELFSAHGMYTGKKLQKFVSLCFDQEYREIHYVGIEMMQRMLKGQDQSWIRVLEKCIITHSWWDTVDWLAKLVGIHFKRFPELQHEYAQKWISGNNMWLQRVVIIHQLFYKETTDEQLLFDMITRCAASKEFFIQKACGWALRQHAKVFPQHVRSFLQHHTLSNLSVREAMKQLNKTK